MTSFTSDFADLATAELVYVGAGGGGTCGQSLGGRGATGLVAHAAYGAIVGGFISLAS